MGKKISKNGKMTLDKLAGIMARSFDEVNNRVDQGFELANKRLEKIEDKLVQIDFQIFEMKSKESVTEKEINILKRRSDNIERRVMTK